MANKQVTLKRVTDTSGNTDNIYPTTEWAQIESKPTTFTPTDHDHTLSDITDAGTVAAIDLNSSTTQFLRGDGTWATVQAGTTFNGGTITGNIEIENTLPKINFTDTNNNSDYHIANNNGTLEIADTTNQAARIQIGSTGNITLPASGGLTLVDKAITNSSGSILWDGDEIYHEGHKPTFSEIASKPTTLSGYGITDAYSSSNPSGYQTAAQVATSISNLVASAPSTLDTLNELAAALGDDPNFATTVSNSIGTKVSSSLLSTAAGANTVVQRDSSGNITTAGQINFANNDGFVYNDTTNIMYVKKDGTDRAIITDDTIGSQSVNYATSAGNAGTLDGIDSSQFLRSDAQDTYTPKRLDMASSANWDEVGFTKQTNLHFQGHNQFWVGAGNGTWFKGSANSKSQSSGLAADANAAHDLLITTMQGTNTYDRGITFAVDNTGAGTSGWRLGKWHSGTSETNSMLAVNGQIHAKGGHTDSTDYYADDYSLYHSTGQGGWGGDSSAGWHKPSIVAAKAIQIQSGTGSTNSSKPQIQFHQYGYGGPGIEYDGPNKTLTIGELGSSTTNRLDYVNIKTVSNLQVNGNTVWHAGNDGAGSGLDADNLDGKTWTSSGKDIRGAEIYSDSWFRNYNASTGLYNQATGMHWYSTANNQFSIYSSQTSTNIRFMTYSGTVRGYVHADDSSDIGFLNSGGAWSLRTDSSKNTEIYGGLIVSGSINSGGYESASQYEAAGTNIILKGDSLGRSGIFFQSEKDGTNINHSSDFGYIQFFSYGVGGSSGESNELVIGVSNDADDHLILNAPNNGLKHRNGATATDYTIWSAYNFDPNSKLNTSGGTISGNLTVNGTGAFNTLEVTGNTVWNEGNLDFSLSGTTLTITTS